MGSENTDVRLTCKLTGAEVIHGSFSTIGTINGNVSGIPAISGNLLEIPSIKCELRDV